MIYKHNIKERPRCRKIIKELLIDSPYLDLRDLAAGRHTSKGQMMTVTDGIRKQATKMLHE